MKSEQTHAENCELKRHALCQSKHKKSSLQVTWINKLFVQIEKEGRYFTQF